MPRILGDHLGHIRVQRGLTQAELAARVGVSRPYITAIEAGHAYPPARVLARITGALGLTADETAPLADLLAARRRAMAPLRPFFRANPVMVDVLGLLGAAPLDRDEAEVVVHAVAMICRGRRAARRQATPARAARPAHPPVDSPTG